MTNKAKGDLADLDLSTAQMRAMGEAVLTRVVAHLAALHDTPSCGDFTDIEDVCRSMRRTHPLIGDQRHLHTVRRAEQDVLDHDGASVGVNPDSHAGQGSGKGAQVNAGSDKQVRTVTTHGLSQGALKTCNQVTSATRISRYACPTNWRRAALQRRPKTRTKAVVPCLTRSRKPLF